MRELVTNVMLRKERIDDMVQVKKQKVRAVEKEPASKPAQAPARPVTSGYLGRVVDHMDESPYIIVVHGVGGIGKTSWAAHSDKPLFLVDDQELGIFDLMASKQIDFKVPVMPKAESWPQVLEMLDEVVEKGVGQGYKTLVLDSATGMEYLCFLHHCEEAYEGDWSRRGFFNYQQGPKSAAKSLWPEFLRKLLAIRSTGMNVIMIAHSQIKSFSNPEGPDFDRWVPYLDKEIWATTFRVMENVFFMNYFVDVETQKGLTSKGKGKGGQRYLYTTWAPAYDAKNRWGLIEPISMGDSAAEAFSNFAELFE
jgi:hypothetical protein